MAKSSSSPHFDHHVREQLRNRQRFQLALAGLFMLTAVLVAAQVRFNLPGGKSTISGRVYDARTGVGIPNVRLSICNFGDAVTGAGGQWSFSGVPYTSNFCVRYIGGAPAGLTGPRAIANNADVGAQSAYENQVAGYDCVHNSHCTGLQQQWGRTRDSGYDFTFDGAAASSSIAASNSTPTTTFGSQPAQAAEPGTTPPTAPASFQATAEGNNAIIQLTWGASTDSYGIKDYVLQRSIDQVTWTTVATVVAATSYTDRSCAYGVHYYYRLSAVDPAGNTSSNVYADAVTSVFVSNSSAEADVTYTSSDNIAVVDVPASAIPNGDECSVELVQLSGGAVPGSQQQPLVAGPYGLVCKDDTGSLVTAISEPLTWTFNLKGKMNNLVNPQAYTYTDAGQRSLVSNAQYDASTSVMTFSTTSVDSTMVLASTTTSAVSANFVAIMVFLFLVFTGLAILILRRQQRVSYTNYLRGKYYNL